ncbi:lysophospholipid acyltransferase family protein [Paucibacter sp. DJ2R-2]|uniref:lysophospholipid acyltransferase family protein n=1 Tax=unclassified Roseateles TaxID=2626991 RepID=UPI0021E41D3F|nr:lysophospholipid acyltransferase family protein [Paucibacter sp. DJ2R-2]MCV2420351.1 1-acyl-sn-glycerol-3-phosphate acyltransferase [Paucibacter sp. DJ4R-1]MCV2436704.1 1-acyl-sn-glycerol-3-phosphate acyltransferase [Paucibacter sp. DJ2R-2]
MRNLLAAWRLLRFVLHVLHGLLMIKLLFPSLSLGQRHHRIRWWSGKMLALMGVRLEFKGQARPGAKLIVANHVSWLDIAAVHAVLPEARFVSKADVKHWPVVGALTAGVGTLFIERTSKRDALRVVHQMADALKAGDTVAVFPEGTTGAGPELLPFHGNLLQAAIATETVIQPLALRWYEPGERFSSSARFIGDTTMIASLWTVLKARGVGIEIQILPALESAHADRRALAEHVREQIAEALAAN